MNNNIEEYVSKRKQEIEKEQYKQKAQRLVDLGIGKRVYSQQTQISDEYPFSDGDMAYSYKFDIGNFTDEEYKEALRYAPKKKKTIPRKIWLAIWLIWLALHFVLLFWGAEYWNPGIEDFLDREADIWPFDGGKLSSDYDFTEFLVYTIVPFIVYWIVKLFKESKKQDDNVK